MPSLNSNLASMMVQVLCLFIHAKTALSDPLSTEEVSLEIRYRVVKRAATLATGPRPQKLAADRDS